MTCTPNRSLHINSNLLLFFVLIRFPHTFSLLFSSSSSSKHSDSDPKLRLPEPLSDPARVSYSETRSSSSPPVELTGQCCSDRSVIEIRFASPVLARDPGQVQQKRVRVLDSTLLDFAIYSGYLSLWVSLLDFYFGLFGFWEKVGKLDLENKNSEIWLLK